MRPNRPLPGHGCVRASGTLVALVSLASASALAPGLAAQETLQFDIRAVAASFGETGGTVMPGSSDGRGDGSLVFVANLNETGAPAAANYNNIAFTGTVYYEPGLPSVRRGLFAMVPDPHAILVTETAAPGTTGGYVGTIAGINIDLLGDVVFSGVWEKTTMPTASGTGIWWSDAALSGFQAPTPVALSGMPAPGTGSNFGGMDAGTLYQSLQFVAFISGGLGNWTWEKSTGQLRRVTYTGMPVEVFGPGLTLKSAGQVLGLDDSGRLLISVTTSDDKARLFLASAPDEIVPIFTTGDDAPGLAGRKIGSLGASINDSGDVAIGVLLDDGDGNIFNNTSALYLFRASAGVTDLITHGGAPIAGLPPGIWGGTPLVNSKRIIYMPGLGTVDPYAGPGATAVFTSIPPVPESINASGSSFNDLGQVLTYVQSPSMSLWFYHPGAGWQKLAKAGEVFAPSGNPNPVVTIRVNTGSSGADGKPTGLTNDGRAVFTVDGRYVVSARMAPPDVTENSGTRDFPERVPRIGTLDVGDTATVNFSAGVDVIETVEQDGGTVNIAGDTTVAETFTFTGGTQSGTGTTTVEGPATLGGPIVFDGRRFYFVDSVYGAADATLVDGAQFEIGEGVRWDLDASVTFTHGDESGASVVNNGTIFNGAPGDATDASVLRIDPGFFQGDTGIFENYRTFEMRGGGEVGGTVVNNGEWDLFGWRAFWEGLIEEAINKGVLRVGHDELGREILVFTELDHQGADAQMEINDAEVRVEYARPDSLKQLYLKAAAKYEMHRAPDATGTEPLLEADEATITGPGNQVIFETPGANGDHTWRVSSSFEFTPGGSGASPELSLFGVSYVAGEDSTITNTGVTLIELSDSSWRVDGSWTVGEDVMVKKHDMMSYFGIYGSLTVPAGRTISVKDAQDDDATLFIRGILQLGGTVDADLKAKGSPLPLIISEVRIGSSPGTGVVNGNMTLAPLSTAFFELGGTQQGVTYDHLDVNGTLTIDSGLIDVRFVNGFEATVAPGDVFVLVEADAPIEAPFANFPSGARRNTSDGLRSFELHYGEGSPHGANRVVATGFAAALTGPPPVISSHPAPQVVVIGGTATFTVAATGDGPFTYQWHRNGVPIAGATGSSYSVTDVQAGQGGSYTVVVTNATGSTTSGAATFSLDTTPRLINVSCRGVAGVGDNTLVMGFYINGTGTKTLLIRGIGPRLADFIPESVVADPRVTVYLENTPIDGVDDWNPALAPEFTRMGGFPLNAGSKDAAMTITLEASRNYTVHLVNTGPAAEALIEVYDLSRDLGSRLTNVSCRFNMQAGQTIILGTASVGGPTHVLARNIGPGIAQYLQNPLDALADPELRVFTGGVEIGANDDWEPATGAYFESTGAFAVPAGSKDAAIRVPLAVGGHTVHATGKGGSGVAIIEIYESRDP